MLNKNNEAEDPRPELGNYQADEVKAMKQADLTMAGLKTEQQYAALRGEVTRHASERMILECCTRKRHTHGCCTSQGVCVAVGASDAGETSGRSEVRGCRAQP